MDVDYSRDVIFKLGDAAVFDNTAGVYKQKIKFEFVVESKYHRYLRNQLQAEYSSTTQVGVGFVKYSFRAPTRHIVSASVPATGSVSLEAIRKAVDEATHNLIERSERERLTKFACEEVRKRVPMESGLGRGYRNLTLCIRVGIINRQYIYVPTTTASASARLLEMYEEENNRPCCCICFDELQGVSSILEFKLPCSHVFHKDCIIKWLRHKTTCPTCRAQTKPLSSFTFT